MFSANKQTTMGEASSFALGFHMKTNSMYHELQHTHLLTQSSAANINN